MPQSKKNKNNKAASGMGNIRKKTSTVNGKTYIYYEARYTEGFDPGTGKQIQRSISGKSQKEVAQKLKAALASLDSGTYIAPSKMTVGEWLDVWSKNYLGGVKESTFAANNATIRTHIKPGLGAIRIDSLDTHMVQSFYNSLREPTERRDAVSPKTVKNPRDPA